MAQLRVRAARRGDRARPHARSAPRRSGSATPPGESSFTPRSASPTSSAGSPSTASATPTRCGSESTPSDCGRRRCRGWSAGSDLGRALCERFLARRRLRSAAAKTGYESGPERGISRGRGSRAGPDCRQAQAHQRAAAGAALGLHRAAVALGDPPDDRQAEPRSRQLASRGGAVEAVEDPRQVLGVDPGPVVADRDLALGRRPSTSTSPPSGLHLIALSSRLETARSSAALDAAHGARARSRALIRTAPAPGSGPARPRPRPAGRAAAGRPARVELASRARSTRSPTSTVSSSSWATTSASSRSRCLVGACRSAWASTSMLVRRLASGVRSSCEASATSWRWESSELSSAFSIVLKLRASAAELGAAARVDASAQVAGLGDLAGGLAEARDGARAPRARRAARAPAPRPIPPRLTSGEDQRQLAQRVVDLLQRARDLDRLAALDRGGVDAQVGAVELGVRENGPALAGGDRLGVRGRRQPGVGLGRRGSALPSASTSCAVDARPAERTGRQDQAPVANDRSRRRSAVASRSAGPRRRGRAARRGPAGR